jgi:hypothetical protein
MNTPFLFHFKQEIPCINPQSSDLEFADWYTNRHTSAHYVKGHRSRSNKWIPGHTVKSKRDRRKNK